MFTYETIVGERLFLRTLTVSDASARYLGWLKDPVVNGYLEVRFSPPYSQEDLAHYIRATNESATTLLLGVFTREETEHIGNIKLGPVNVYHRTAEVGFLIGDRRHWRMGYATEAIRMVTDYAFERLNVKKVTAGCYAENIGSCYALLRAGFQQEGLLSSQWECGGKRQDGILFGKLSPFKELAKCEL